jgi:hypothetical protein
MPTPLQEYELRIKGGNAQPHTRRDKAQAPDALRPVRLRRLRKPLDPQLLDDPSAEGDARVSIGEDDAAAAVVQDRDPAAHPQAESEEAAGQLLPAADLSQTRWDTKRQLSQRAEQLKGLFGHFPIRRFDAVEIRQ